MIWGTRRIIRDSGQMFQKPDISSNLQILVQRTGWGGRSILFHLACSGGGYVWQVGEGGGAGDYSWMPKSTGPLGGGRS